MIFTAKTARAFAFADRAHWGQTRKYTEDPYIVHPIEVVSLIRQVQGHTEDMICAAYLHDVVEDTSWSISAIQKRFGDVVAAYVEALTDPPKVPGVNRATRKHLERQRLAAAPPEVQTIKLADLISNTQFIVEHDPDFAKVYLREKRDLLAVMTQRGSPHDL